VVESNTLTKMSEDILRLSDVKKWLESKRNHLVDGVVLAEVRTNSEHIASAAADFDASWAIGRISVWVTGEIDFEVLRRSDSSVAFFEHQTVSKIEDAQLEDIYNEFLQHLLSEAPVG